MFWEFHEIWDGAAGQWARLAARLEGAGVPSLDEAMRELQLEPVHAPLRAVFADGLVTRVLDGVTTADGLAELQRRYATFLGALAEATGVTGDALGLAEVTRDRVAAVFGPAGAGGSVGRAADLDRRDRAALLGWLAFSRMGELADMRNVAATSRAWYDELQLLGAFAAGLREGGLDEGDARAAADLVRVLLALPRPSDLRGPARTADARLLDQLLGQDTVRAAMGVNIWEGVEYLDRDRFEGILGWAARLDAMEAGAPARADTPAWLSRLVAAAKTAGYRVEPLRRSLAGEPRSPDRPVS